MWLLTIAYLSVSRFSHLSDVCNTLIISKCYKYIRKEYRSEKDFKLVALSVPVSSWGRLVPRLRAGPAVTPSGRDLDPGFREVLGIHVGKTTEIKGGISEMPQERPNPLHPLTTALSARGSWSTSMAQRMFCGLVSSLCPPKDLRRVPGRVCEGAPLNGSVAKS